MARLAERRWDPPAPDPAAPLAVLVHGIGSSSLTWWRVGPALAERGWRVVAVDLRGHGGTTALHAGGDGRPGRVSLDDLAADVRETVTERPLGLLLGHSLGALVVLAMAAAEPDVARLVALEDPPCQAAVDWAVLADELASDAARARSEPEALRADLMAPPTNLAEGDADAKVASLRLLDADQALAELLHGTDFDVAAMAAAVTAPSLLFLGRAELGSLLTGPDRAAVATGLPRGWTEVLDCGHSVHREAFESYLRRLDAWLAREGDGVAPAPGRG